MPKNLEENFIKDVWKELARAREKFPSNTLGFVALIEEVGELAQAKLKHRAGKGSIQAIWEEAVQVAAMAIRIATERDVSFDVFYTEPEMQKRVDQARKDHT